MADEATFQTFLAALAVSQQNEVDDLAEIQQALATIIGNIKPNEAISDADLVALNTFKTAFDASNANLKALADQAAAAAQPNAVVPTAPVVPNP